MQKVSSWRRVGFSYVTEHRVYAGGKFLGTCKKKLDFIAYHLIRWFHGDEKLEEMANDMSRFMEHYR